MRPSSKFISVSIWTAFAVIACHAAPIPAAKVEPPPPPMASPVQETPSAPDSASVQALAPPDAPRRLPTACAASAGGSGCMLPDDFVDRLCSRPFVDTTLALFQKSAPWTHAYLRGKVDAWYTGARSTRATLAFDEEVLVLRFHPLNSGSMAIEGATGSYDVLRWDGRCFTLESAEITTNRPPAAKAARLQWDRIGAPMQGAVLKSEDVKRAYDKRNKACKGVARDDLPPACDSAESTLSVAVANHVRTVGGLPDPVLIP